jgi:biotin carboxyl carrier protein
MTKGVKFGIGAAVVIAVAALGVISAKKNSTKPVEVRTEAVEARDLVASVTASGQIQPRTKVDVSADVTGKIVRLSVKEGDVVKKGQAVCIIEAMKLMNEIESEVSGVVVKILVENGSPVSPGQPIMIVKPQ